MRLSKTVRAEPSASAALDGVSGRIEGRQSEVLPCGLGDCVLYGFPRSRVNGGGSAGTKQTSVLSYVWRMGLMDRTGEI